MSARGLGLGAFGRSVGVGLSTLIVSAGGVGWMRGFVGVWVWVGAW